MEQQTAAVLQGSTASQPPPKQRTSPIWAGQPADAVSATGNNHATYQLMPSQGLPHPSKRACTQGPSAASNLPALDQPAASYGLRTGSTAYSSHRMMTLLRSLLDMPDPWLLQLLPRLDRDSLLALFRTCVRLRNFILRHAQRVTLTLLPNSWPNTRSPPGKPHQLLSVKALQLADQHGSNLQLRSIRSCSEEMFRVVTGYTFTVLKMAHTINAVTQLVLHEVMVEMPLMNLLSDILPNLTTYTLSNSCIQWPSTSTDMGSSRGAFAKLRSLEMIDIVDYGTSSVWREHITQQVKNLTALKRMAFASIHTADAWRSGAAQELFLVAALPSTAQQLTTLTLKTCILEAVMQQVVSTQFCALQELQLCDHTLTDEDMPWLLGMPHLKALEVSHLGLDQSWAGQPCGWRELYCAWYSTEQLARLPLHRNLHLKDAVANRPLVLDLGRDESIQAAVTAVTDSQLPDLSRVEVLYADNDKGRPICLDHRLKQAAPLLVSAKYVCLPLYCFTVQGVLAWLDARPAPKQAMCLQLGCVYQWPVSDVEQLIGSLPAGISIVLDAWSMESLVDMCCLASHGVTLHVMLDEKYGKIAMLPDIQAQLYKRGKQDIQVHDHTLPSGSPWKRCVTAQHMTAAKQPSSQLYVSACVSLSTIMGCILHEEPKRFAG